LVSAFAMKVLLTVCTRCRAPAHSIFCIINGVLYRATATLSPRTVHENQRFLKLSSGVRLAAREAGPIDATKESTMVETTTDNISKNGTSIGIVSR